MASLEYDPIAQLSLPPGFRFFPTDEELLVQYLCRKAAGHQFSLQIIAEIDLYKFNPWILPSKALFGEKEWYFFSPRDRKYPNGSRPNRVAGSGYWKATGTDKVISSQGRKVGIKKALVFYIGKAPKGTKTNWIMHEYRLADSPRKTGSSKLDDWVLCRIYKKTSSAEKSMASASSKEVSAGGSSPSTSSSPLDDVLESLPEINDRSFALPRMNSLRGNQQEEEQKVSMMTFGSGSIDWSVLAGLTAGPEFGPSTAHNQQHLGMYNGGDVCVPSLPPLRHVESPQEKLCDQLEDEVQRAIRDNYQRVGSGGGLYRQSPNMMMGQTYLNSVDPFAIRYTAPNPMTGFGFRQ
ncbi:hypothetical protein V2J09_023763 [Rumex salicifolius]